MPAGVETSYVVAKGGIDRARGGTVGSYSSFVGRGDEIGAIEDHFARGARVVTLYGAGGIGKSRLANAVARRRRRETFFVDLAEVTTGQGVADALAAALGLRAQPNTNDRIGEVGAHLAGVGDALVVVDEAESATEPLALTLEALEAICPATQWLVTSRELLRLGGEVAFEVGPLRVPSGPDDREAEAMKLFLERALLVRATPREAELPDVVAVLQALDGIPLAIELAAGCLDVMTVAELRARMPRQLDALSTRDRTLPARKRTLRAAIETSWRRLSDAERATLAQCTLFRGAFSLDWAERVVHLASDAHPVPVADALASLRARSLVCSPSATERSSGAPLRLFESVRLHAREHLATEDLRAAERRYVACFVELARATRIASEGATRADDTIHAALENYLAAHALALRLDPDGARTIALAVGPALQMHRGPRPAIALLTQTLEALPPHVPRGRLLVERARLRRVAAVAAQARADAEEGITAAVAEGDEVAQGLGLVLRAQIMVTAGMASHDGPNASAGIAATFVEAITLLERGNDARALAEALCAHAVLLNNVGDPAGAWRPRLRAADLSSRIGFHAIEAQCASMAGVLSWSTGQLDEALRHQKRALEIAVACGDRRCEGIARTSIAAIWHDQGAFDAALTAYDEAREMHRRLGHRTNEAWATAYSAMLLHERGELASARRRYEEALGLLEATGWVVFTRFVRASLGALLADADDLGAARVLLELEPQARDVSTPIDRACSLRNGHAILAQARAARDAGERARFIAQSEALLADVATSYPNEDVRCARRMLAAACTTMRAAEDEGVLRVGRNGAWFEVACAPRVDLGRRHLLRRLLLTLAEHHRVRPGEPIETPVLVARAWPGERASADALSTRMRVAINRLRTLGLRQRIVTTPGGYGFDRPLRVRFVNDL